MKNILLVLFIIINFQAAAQIQVLIPGGGRAWVADTPYLNNKLLPYSKLKYVNLPLFLANDSTVEIPASNAGTDGYLPAIDWSRFDSAAKMFKDTILTLPAIVPKDNKMIFAKQYLLGPSSFISFYNAAWDATPYPVFWAGPTNQSVFIGSRGGARRFQAGTLTGTNNVTLGEFSGDGLTTGSNNTFLGRSAGFSVTTGSNNIYIGASITGTATGSDSIVIGAALRAKLGMYAIGPTAALVDQRYRLRIGGMLAIDTVPESSAKDSLLSKDNGGVTAIAIADLFISGDFTPTLTNGVNVASSSIGADDLFYQKIGSIVNCTVMLTVTPTSGTTLTQIELTLPVSSNFTVFNDLKGSGSAVGSSYVPAIVTANETNDRAKIEFTSTNTASHSIVVQFTYRVI